jgi:hypothetical protein
MLGISIVFLYRGGFCLKKFFATEAAFRSVLLLFNLLGELQRAAGLPRYREPAAIRTQVLTCGAILGRAGRRMVVHLSASCSWYVGSFTGKGASAC